MIPRFFVSSTYYDLKHVRERLEKFIENYGFEPILFESDKVTYQHGKEIDQSAYFEVGLCHIMALVVGGRYGSPSSTEKVTEARKKYDDDYISITRKEFETAIARNIPILIFIDKNVYSEYQTYKQNQEFFDMQFESKSADGPRFKFAHVDHVNIFKFIDQIRSQPIKTFEKIEEIESYIKIQLSGMFYLYLESLKKTSDDKRILNTIEELNNVTLRMNEMLTSVGREILGPGKVEYEKVIDSQLEIVLDFYKEKFSNSIAFGEILTDDEIINIDLNNLAKYIYNKSLKVEMPKYGVGVDYTVYSNERTKFIKTTFEDIKKHCSKISSKLDLKRYDFEDVNITLHRKVLPLIRDIKDEDRIIAKLRDALHNDLTLPF